MLASSLLLLLVPGWKSGPDDATGRAGPTMGDDDDDEAQATVRWDLTADSRNGPDRCGDIRP